MDKPIKTALASFGMSGRIFHAPLLMACDKFKITSVVQRSSDLAKELLPDITIVRDFEGLLTDANIELIIVNTPDMFHYEHARMALEAGKHVVVEKPFVQTVKQGEYLIRLANENGLVLSVFHNRRWDNSFLTVRKVINEGLVGKLVEYEARYDRYRPAVPTSWKEEPEMGAGILQNLGSHLIDQALLLFGNPSKVFCQLHAMRENSRVSDFLDLKFQYPNLSVTLKASYLVKTPGPSYVLHGDTGSFRKHGLDPQEEALKNGLSPLSERWGSDPSNLYGFIDCDVAGIRYQGQIETIPGNYLAFYESIHDAIREGFEPAVKPIEALDVIRVIESALMSNEQMRWVNV